jgi:hypothetical protein
VYAGRSQGLSYYVCLMIEGSGDPDPDAGPKNIWIRRIQIRNTALAVGQECSLSYGELITDYHCTAGAVIATPGRLL